MDNGTDANDNAQGRPMTADRAEIRRRLQRLLTAGLSRSDCLLLILYADVQALTVAEIAAIVGRDPAEVDERLAVALQRIGADALSDQPPPVGEIVSRVRAWLRDDHPLVNMLDCPFSDNTIAFLDDCAEQIAERGNGARFSERQIDFARSIYRQAVQSIKTSVAHNRRLEREAHT